MPSDKPKILVVDDKPQNLYAMELLLQKLDVEVVQAQSGFEALELILEHDFSVGIIDVQMPEMDGYELVELLRGNKSTAHLPVIFVSAILSDEYHHRKGYEAGAVDFLSKPFRPEILLSKVRIFLDLYEQRRQLQTVVNQLNEANSKLSRRALQLETSNEIGQKVTSILDLPLLLKETISLIRGKLDYYFVGIYLYNNKPHTLVLKAGVDAQGVFFQDELGIDTRNPTIVGHVVQTAEAYLSNDTTADPRYVHQPHTPATLSELALPLFIGNKSLGVLDIHCQERDAFQPHDVTVLQTIANQVAISIQNAQLYAQVVGFSEELEAKVKERTAKLQEAYHQLELLDHNKSDFISIVSHELRTPLTLIKGYGEMLLDDKVLAANTQHQLQISGIVNGAKRMHEIVNLMLDMVKIDNRTLNLKVGEVSLSSLLRMLLKYVTELSRDRELTFTVEGIDELPVIFADSDALTKLFEHLLINAIKYTPDGGEIRLLGQLLPDPADTEMDYVKIVIKDTGIGIDPNFHDIIFNKFYQTGAVSFHSSGKTKFKGGGPGLGLAIAKGIVEAHQGRIWVESPGYDEKHCPGSEFHVLLPLKQSQRSAKDIVRETGPLPELP